MKDLLDLIDADPHDRTQPDVPGLIRAGRRIQLRRRAGAGAVGALAVATVVVGGVGLRGPGTPQPLGFADAPTRGASSQAPRHPGPNLPGHPSRTGSRSSEGASSCPVDTAIYLCETPPAEHRTPVGSVIRIGHTVSGAPEVLYAVQQPGSDLDSGQPEMVIALKAGLDKPDGLYGERIGLQPGFDSRLQSPIPMSGGTQSGRYAIVGEVQGDVGAVTWTDASGTDHPVTGQSTTIVPGYTVFWLYGTSGQGPAYDFDKVVVHAGSHSCALLDCAAQGAI